MNLPKLMVLLLAGLSLPAFASPAVDAPVDWKGGARRGWIVEIYSSDTPAAKLPACIASLPPDALASRHFVKARYRHVRVMHSVIAEVPDTQTFHVDDEVELRPADCAAGKFARIERVLAPASQ